MKPFWRAGARSTPRPSELVIDAQTNTVVTVSTKPLAVPNTIDVQKSFVKAHRMVLSLRW